MCGRFVQVIDIDLFIKRFGIIRPKDKLMESSYNVAPGDLAYVITNDRPNEIQAFQFGLTPSWAKKPMYLINARAEGDLNSQNELNFEGVPGILKKPSFRTSIRSQRCLVIANAFFEGPQEEKLNKPFLISRKDKEIFSFAGIWDTWVDNRTGTVTNSFSIITTVASEATQQIGHPRSPVILAKENEKLWLDTQLPIEKLVGLLKPLSGNLFQLDAVSVRVKDPKNKGRDLIIPIEEGGSDQYEIKVSKDLRLEGMGSGKRKSSDQPVQTKLFD